MSWYAEVISYNRETIRYGKAAWQSTYRYKPFFFSQNFSVVFITESHEELWGKSDVMAGKKKPEKCLWIVWCKQSPLVTPFKLIHSSSWGEKNIPLKINESLFWVCSKDSKLMSCLLKCNVRWWWRGRGNNNVKLSLSLCWSSSNCQKFKKGLMKPASVLQLTYISSPSYAQSVSGAIRQRGSVLFWKKKIQIKNQEKKNKTRWLPLPPQ